MRLPNVTPILIAAALSASACGQGSPDVTASVGEARAETSVAPPSTSTTWEKPASSVPRTAPATTARPATTAPPVSTAPSVAPAFDGIWPTSREVLDEQAAAFAQGHQPWRADPVAVAREFLDSLYLDELTLGSYVPSGGGRGEVPFEAGGVAGAVVIGRASGNPLPYVVSLTSSRIRIVDIQRDVRTLRFRLSSSAPGTLLARAGVFASEWHVERTVPAPSYGEVEVTLTTSFSDVPLMVQVRHEGADGRTGIAQGRVEAVARR